MSLGRPEAIGALFQCVTYLRLPAFMFGACDDHHFGAGVRIDQDLKQPAAQRYQRRCPATRVTAGGGCNGVSGDGPPPLARVRSPRGRSSRWVLTPLHPPDSPEQPRMPPQPHTDTHATACQREQRLSRSQRAHRESASQSQHSHTLIYRVPARSAKPAVVVSFRGTRGVG